MADTPTAVLESLLEGGEDDLFQWWESESFEPDSYEWTASHAECLRQFKAVLRQVTHEWGTPDSSGTVTVEEGGLCVPDLYPFSICEFVEEVAIWDCSGHVACVWWGVMEHRTQFEVCFGVAAGG